MNPADNEFPEMREIPGFPYYYVTEHGNIYRQHGLIDVRQRKPFAAKNGYLIVTTKNNGQAYSLLIHKAVALAWLPPREPHQTVIRHLNGIKTDNRASNLKWGTHAENTQDAILHGSYKRAARANKIAAFQRLQKCAEAGYLPQRTNVKDNTKRVRIWIALRKKIMRDGRTSQEVLQVATQSAATPEA